MAGFQEIIVTLPSGRRVDAQVGNHLVRTDQPKNNGGEDSAPSPFDLFLASLGTCAGIFVQGFCAKREIPTKDIRLVARPRADAQGAFAGVDIDIEVPESFPEQYRDAVARVAEQCTVKRAIASSPTFAVKTVAKPR